MARRPRSGVLALAALAAVLAVYNFVQGPRASTDGPPAAAPLLAAPAFLGMENKQVHNAVVAAFPGAMKGSAVMSTLFSAVKPFGLKKSNTIYGQSICSDEINGDKGHLPTVLTKYFGTSFFLGGIGGAPYVGKTGFGAFAAHVPDDGHVVLVFGPHIGISPQGEPGKFLRDGQSELSTSCGAAIAAYSQCTSGTPMKPDELDMEQSWLREKLGPRCEELAESSNLMVDLVLEAYKEVEAEVFRIVNTNFGSGNLVLLGGIQINMPYPLPGYWVPLHFSIRAAGKHPADLMVAFQ
uniref:Limiting CO2-inducible protein B/C beta carbonyic anhydrase domain-containing protein n=1 Tax=Alexandrium monilatum TaxID=311494 RepID=A0A7S4T8V7_9DINO